MKSIRTDFLIHKLADNLDKKFQIKHSQISSHIALLLDGVVHHATVAGNLQSNFKRRHNKKISCPKCGKKIKDLVLHNARSHGGKINA